MSVTKTRRGPRQAVRRRLTREERRKQLLAAARALIETQGLKSLTMERLAHEAAISKPVVYSHFTNRSAILVALFEDYWHEVDALVPDAAAPSETPGDFIRRSFAAYLDVIEERGSAIRQLLVKVIEDPLVEAARTRRNRQVVAHMARNIAAYYRLPPERAETAALMLRAATEAGGDVVTADRSKRALVEATFFTLATSSLAALEAEAAPRGPAREAGKRRA